MAVGWSSLIETTASEGQVQRRADTRPQRPFGLLEYAQMRAMFIAAPPEFEVVMARLAEADRTLNASGAS